MDLHFGCIGLAHTRRALIGMVTAYGGATSVFGVTQALLGRCQGAGEPVITTSGGDENGDAVVGSG